MLERLSPAIAANRFGLGAKPAELTQIGSQPRDWLHAQLPSDEEWRIEWVKFYYGLDLADAFRASGDPRFLEACRLRDRVGVEDGLGNRSAPRPEAGADHLVRVGLAGDFVGRGRVKRALEWCDRRLLKRVPSLSRQCRYVVITLRREG